MQFKLRDIEVANDDFERQARNTTSSLEDMESKYSQAIERGIMLDEEMKAGEQEREKLRIESQRLREELADLKIEAELMQDKIKKHEARHLSAISTDLSLLGSPTFDKNADASPNSTASSPLVTTPPETKPSDAARDPPSPPMSDASSPKPKAAPAKAPGRKSRLPSLNGGATAAAARGPSGRLSGVGAPLRTPASRASKRPNMPASNSLSHIRSLTAQMQRLEARVRSARSKLPASTTTPPRASPRTASSSHVPATVTIRSRKRASGSVASSAVGNDTTPTNANARASQGHVPRFSTSGISRLSFGPLPNRGPDSDMSRPSSRASLSSYARPSSRADRGAPARPMSRTSLSGVRTPLGRSRSSLSGSMHGQAAGRDEGEGDYRTPSRRGTYSRLELEAGVSGIPVPGSGIPTPSTQRLSTRRRTSTPGRESAARRPSIPGGTRLEDLGETY